MSKKSEARDKITGAKKFEEIIVAEDGGEVTEEMQEIYEYDREEKKKEPRQYKERALAKRPKQSPAIMADVLELPRVCENCYLMDKCRHYDEEATCKFRTQVNINSAQDMIDLLRAVIEIQGERILFGRFIESMEGGYVDRNLSEEIKRLMELIKNFKEIVTDEESISIKVKGKEAVKTGGGGILSQIFGGGSGGGKGNSEEG